MPTPKLIDQKDQSRLSLIVSEISQYSVSAIQLTSQPYIGSTANHSSRLSTSKPPLPPMPNPVPVAVKEKDPATGEQKLVAVEQKIDVMQDKMTAIENETHSLENRVSSLGDQLVALEDKLAHKSAPTLHGILLDEVHRIVFASQTAILAYMNAYILPPVQKLKF